MISTPSGKGGKRVRREKWMLSIEADPDWVKEKLQAMKLDALPGNGLALLPGGDVEDTVLPEAEVEGEAIVEGKVTEAPKVSQDDPVIKFTPRHYAMAVDDKKAPDMDAAADWLNRSVLPLGVADDVILKWLGHFNSGLDLHEGIEDKAAIYANNKYAKHNKGAY